MRLLLTLLLCVCPLLAAQTPTSAPPPHSDAATVTTQLYRTQYQSPQSLIAALQPLFGEELSFSRQGRQLLMRGPSTILQQAHSLLKQLDHPPQQLRVELSNHPHRADAKTFSTASRGWQSTRFEIEENQPLLLQQGKQAQTVAGAGHGWVKVDTLTTELESLQLQVRTTDDSVYVAVDARTLKGGQFERVRRTVSGKPNQWISLSGEPPAEGEQTWSTAAGRTTDLYIKVSVD